MSRRNKRQRIAPPSQVGASSQKEYYYYTRWTFKTADGEGDNCGPFHNAVISHRPPAEYLNDIRVNNLSEFFYKEFSDKLALQHFHATFDYYNQTPAFPSDCIS